MSERNCQIELIGSYLDDELDAAALAQFEAHLKDCVRCKAELAEQRRLLGTLDSFLNHASSLSLPTNFARVVAAHAESDMSGVRKRKEPGRALRLCALLALASLAFLGMAARGFVFDSARKVGRPLAVVIEMVWNTSYDAITGLMVISRVVSRSFLPASHLVGLLGFLLLMMAVLLLSHLIASYHRTSLIE
jgi:anti-sigma factor RsiW